MAVIHFAYRFDAQDVNQKLHEQIVENGVLYPLKLQVIAQDIMRQPSEKLLKILPNLRYGDDWLEDPDNDQSQTHFWYLAYLANRFQEVPSLSNNRFHGSHYILERILPNLGWQTHEVYEICFGKPFEKLLIGKGFQILADELNLDGGCLSHAEATHLKDKMIQTNADFSIDSALPDGLLRYAEANEEELAILIEKAFFDAIEMLSSVDSDSDALFLFRD